MNGFAHSSWVIRPSGGQTERVDLIDKFSAEFVADPPGQPALPRIARGKDDGELRRDVHVFGNDLDAAGRDIPDHAIARKTAGPELDLGAPLAVATFGFPPIYEHAVPQPRSVMTI